MACVTAFGSEDEAVAIANDTPYGLSGSIWTQDVGRAVRVARAVPGGNLLAFTEERTFSSRPAKRSAHGAT